MIAADGSSCQRLSPWRYEDGNAWWLLCQASPQVGIASQATLRDSSAVAYSWRPKKWQIELMLNVAWWTKKIRAAPPQSSQVSPTMYADAGCSSHAHSGVGYHSSQC